MTESHNTEKPAVPGAGASLEFGNVSVLVIDPDRTARDSIRMVLHNNGFRGIDAGGNFAYLQKALAEDPGPDLVICEAELPDGELCAFVNELRHQQTEFDPFLPVVATTWTPTPELVKRVVNSGADDLLVKPLSTDALLQRIYSLAVARRPFVVTSDYVGPDRHRTEGRPNKAKLLRAPNRLSARTMGSEDEGAFKAAAAAARAAVNGQKIGRQVEKIEVLLQRIMPVLKVRRDAATVAEEVKALAAAATEAANRCAGADQEPLAEPCRQLAMFAGLIEDGMWDASNDDIERLAALSKSIRAAYGDVAQSAEAGAVMVPPDADAASRGERRQKALLRLLSVKLSHLLNGESTRHDAISRRFLKGFDDYLVDLLGQELYDDLTPKARFLLDRIDGGSDAAVWETIQEKDEYWAFAEAVLARILLRFSDFERGRAHFIEIVTRALAEDADDSADAAQIAGDKPFTEAQFDIVFTALFADIFYALGSAAGRRRLDATLGAGKADQLDGIRSNYRRYLERTAPGGIKN